MRRLVLLVCLLAACDKGRVPNASPVPVAGPQTPEQKAHGPLPWIADDWDAAVARARAGKKPIVIDAWTRWCHTCLSMQAFVLADPAMKPYADRFVWLAVDYELPKNAKLAERFPATAFPTFFIIDGQRETVATRWLGSASLDQFRQFLADGERAVQLSHATEMPAGDPLAQLIAGDRAATAEQYAEAVRRYRAALDAGGPAWPRRPDVLVALISALRKTDHSACVDLGLEKADQTGNTAMATDFLVYALDCAGELPPEDPRPGTLRALAEQRLAALVADGKAPLSADDRGDAYGYLARVRTELGDQAGTRAAHEARVALLAAAMKKAPDPTAAMTFDPALVESYVFLDRSDEAVALLLEREKQLPRDYNPAHRLARVYFLRGELDKATAAIDRALALADGPRKGGILGLQVDILAKKGDKEGARKALSAQIAWYEQLPEGQKRPQAVEAAKQKMEKLSAPAPAAPNN